MLLARMTSAAAIELRGLSRYFGERTALSDVTLTVPAGATLAVLGRNAVAPARR
jgi:ABC-type multidrug transport system ATPase subunit